MGKNREVIVCGTVVSMRKSNSGNIWLNLDKSFPNQVFSAYIPKDKQINFSYDPFESWSNEKVCIKSKIQDFDKTPTMRIDRPKQVTIMNN
jgi:endonuclease G